MNDAGRQYSGSGRKTVKEVLTNLASIASGIVPAVGRLANTHNTLAAKTGDVRGKYGKSAFDTLRGQSDAAQRCRDSQRETKQCDREHRSNRRLCAES